jgi:mRNA interferase MazF
MLTSGDVVVLDLGLPVGREAGFARAAMLVTAQRILDGDPTVIQVVPLTSTVRSFRSEVQIAADGANGLVVRSAAQCQHVRAVSTGRVGSVRGNVGPMILSQVRETLALIFDLPS